MEEIKLGKIQDDITKLASDEEKYGVRMVLAAFEDFDKELADIAKQVSEAHNPGIHVLKARLGSLIGNTNSAVSRFQNILPTLSRKGWDLINRIWRWFTGNLIEILDRIGKILGISGYSVGTTTGFPTGVSASLTIHFTIEYI